MTRAKTPYERAEIWSQINQNIENAKKSSYNQKYYLTKLHLEVALAKLKKLNPA